MSYDVGGYPRTDAGGHASWNWTCDGCGEFISEEGWEPGYTERLPDGREITLCDDCAGRLLDSMASGQRIDLSNRWTCERCKTKFIRGLSNPAPSDGDTLLCHECESDLRSKYYEGPGCSGCGGDGCPDCDSNYNGD